MNLGNLDDSIFVFGGPYSNLQATQKVLDIAKNNGFSKNNIICTGDVVAYCGHPLETTKLIMDTGIHVVMGNCEESFGFSNDDCGCGFSEDSACDLLSKQWFTYANAQLGNSERQWMSALPRQITMTMGGQKIAFVHGTPKHISGWVFQSTPAADKAAFLDDLGCDAIVAGHCGIPFISSLEDGRQWINAGVCGMPANDGTQTGWYGIFSPCENNSGFQVQLENFTYDTEAAVQAMYDANLPDAYARALRSGLWPNMDVLPDAEKSQQGIEIDFGGLS